jgi:hypothetical protein
MLPNPLKNISALLVVDAELHYNDFDHLCQADKL